MSESTQFPTYRCVISRYLYLRNENQSESVRNLFKIVHSELENTWSKTCIPIKEKKKVLDLLVDFHKQWESMKKLNKSYVKNPTKVIEAKIQSFKEKLDSLCDLSVVNVYETTRLSRLPSWKEDWEFLGDQRKSRKLHLGGIVLPDAAAIIREKKREYQTQLLNERAQRSRKQLSDGEIIVELEDSTDDEMNISASEDDAFSLPSCNRRKTPEVVTLRISPYELITGSAQCADRIGLSVRSHLFISADFVGRAGGKLFDFSLSKSSIWRKRLATRIELSATIKNGMTKSFIIYLYLFNIIFISDWLKNNPKNLIVHWDTKLFSLNDGQKQERIAVIVSGCQTG